MWIWLASASRFAAVAGRVLPESEMRDVMDVVDENNGDSPVG